MKLLGISLLALLAAACGSSGPSSTTSGSPNNPATAAYKYTACMRNHGLSNFPDPRVTTGSGGSVSIRQTMPASDAASPHFKSAQKACSGILPAPQGNGPTQAEQQARKRVFLAFASCLRTHGVPKFPDPNGQGQLTLAMINAAGVDLHAPAFLPAARSCVSVTHGMITLGQVAQAINGPH